MKQGIHPKYVETKVTCGCGNSFVTRSSKPELKVDICSACHPFYTGKLKYVDTAGRIEKFKTRYAATPAAAPAKKVEPKAKPAMKVHTTAVMAKPIAATIAAVNRGE